MQNSIDERSWAQTILAVGMFYCNEKVYSGNRILFHVCVYGQKNVNVSIGFKNDYEDVYHLSLIICTPDGKASVTDVKAIR